MDDHSEFIKRDLVPLHQLRQLVAEDDAERKAEKDAFEAQHADKWANQKLRKNALERFEAGVETDALRLYSTIPNATKTFLPGVTIRDTKFFTYSPEAALAWAVQHDAKIALSLKDAPYKKLIEFGGAPGQFYTEPTVAIARDLGPIVASMGEAVTDEALFTTVTPAEQVAIPTTEAS